jgi:hypothetical protein
MPKELKRYMEYKIFPWIQLKVGQGISLSTACCWRQKEGFSYISHKKGLYFDGHDWPDVIAYRQNEFLPSMKQHKPCLVHYTVGDVDREVDMSTVQPQNYVERRLVMCP